MLKSKGDELVALQQSKYLKNHFSFFGLKAEERRKLIKFYFANGGEPPVDSLEKTIKKAYAFEEREMHYFAIELLERQKKKWQEAHLGLAVWLITNNSWWDTVDLIATHLVGGLLKKFPTLIHHSDQWVKHENMWLRRTALLYQLGYKEKTDADKLFSYCKMLAHEKEFFIKKAIGWALRQHGKYYPEAVKKFVEENVLSPLSKREALKHLT